MKRKIDPVEYALDAYLILDTDQQATFALALKHVQRFTAQIGHAAGHSTPVRGRPKGSKNRKADTPTAQELDLRHNNGAAAEGL